MNRLKEILTNAMSAAPGTTDDNESATEKARRRAYETRETQDDSFIEVDYEDDPMDDSQDADGDDVLSESEPEDEDEPDPVVDRVPVPAPKSTLPRPKKHVPSKPASVDNNNTPRKRRPVPKRTASVMPMSKSTTATNSNKVATVPDPVTGPVSSGTTAATDREAKQPARVDTPPTTSDKPSPVAPKHKKSGKKGKRKSASMPSRTAAGSGKVAVRHKRKLRHLKNLKVAQMKRLFLRGGSYRTTGLAVTHIQQIARVIMQRVTTVATINCQHRKQKTINNDDVKRAFQEFGMRLYGTGN